MTALTTAALPTLAEAAEALAATLPVPAYPRDPASAGIVHFGVGAFHRSHEAMFLDRLFHADPEAAKTWGICGVGVLPSDAAMRDALVAQDFLYTLVTRAPDTADGAQGPVEGRVIGSIMDYLFAPDDYEAVIRRLAAPGTRIVSLTVTEAGYPVDDASGLFDPADASVVGDLADPESPHGVFGMITQALGRRRDAGVAAFTVMSCDNIPSNGAVARTALTSYASLVDPELGAWIEANVAFPNSMVDRITPATTDAGRAEVASRFGVDDVWPVLSESFEQWVLEDRFTLGRPAFETVGVQVVDEVAPYELMKLRLLNASHQAMSYLGLLSGFTTVHDACRDVRFRAFLLGYMHDEAVPTLAEVPGIDLDSYSGELIERFSSTAIADTLARQVVDGSARLPKFLLPVLRDELAAEGPIERMATVIAAWGVWLARDEGVVDRWREPLVEAARREEHEPGALLGVRLGSADMFGELAHDARFVSAYLAARTVIVEQGPLASMAAVTVQA